MRDETGTSPQNTRPHKIHLDGDLSEDKINEILKGEDYYGKSIRRKTIC